ncbi:hypothetical protein [Agromyces bracchium]|uniref:Uncharacterized protein n=1 Tax=Agromyces bracchium TaxID=88376 RepID=A0A6I3ME71_9MICO|nr:hypothetical protein [Agromyces bracchium]MTH70297.1 hypothetical protein [Agromyces bracchium]
MPWSVTVSPGFALSACGDDICLPDAVRIDIRQPRPSGSDVCGPPVDPWCAPMRQRRDPDRTYYLAIRYAEQQTRPVRGACSCGCDGDPCEYSRIAESWTFAVLDSLPDCHDESTRGPVGGEEGGLACSREIRARGTRRCPDCCDPWVVLADLRVTASGTVSVDPLAHRRFLAQLGEHAFFCGPDTQPKRVDFSAVERETIAGLFAAGERRVVDAGAREAVLTSPATALRGGKASKAIRTLVESMSVGELAGLDSALLHAKAADLGADADAVDRLVESARIAVRLAQPG